MSRRRRKSGHGNHERWLVSYADFITLLFAFFVVLYAASQVDKNKASALAASIQQAFHSMGVFSGQTKGPPLDEVQSLPIEVPGLLDASLRYAPPQTFDKPPHQLDASKSLAELRKELEAALAPEIRRHELSISTGRDGLIISLREFGFFDSGSASLRPDAVPAFSKLAAILAENQFLLRVEGHTDNVPIHNPRFHSNWELSTARATETIRLFLTEFRLDPSRISAAGYAEYHPVTSNATVEGRSVNRRVDIVVLAATSHLETYDSAVQVSSPPSR